MVSADCAQDKACIAQKCADPCPGTCGLNARCQVVNHNPICSCSPGFTGDPFVRCLQESKKFSSSLNMMHILEVYFYFLLHVNIKIMQTKITGYSDSYSHSHVADAR